MVTQVEREQSAYAASFQKLERSAAWVERLRESAFARFEELGFPTTDDEEWKYTNVAPIVKAGFAPNSGERAHDLDNADQVARFIYDESAESCIVVINGIYRPELSSLKALPETIVVMSFAEALRDESQTKILREHLARYASYQENAFTALNTAFLSGGILLRIPRGVSINAPLQLLFLADAENVDKPLIQPRVLVLAERESVATLIESYASWRDEDENAYWTNAVIEIALEDGARLEHYRLQRESTSAFHVAATSVALKRDSSYNSTTINFGAQLARHNINVSFEEKGAECWVDGLYVVGDGQHSDTHSLIDHRHANCKSHQLYKGILDGKSRAVFNGKVFVHEGAQKTDAMQTNKNLLLSNEARVDTKPQLEIFADDVKCAHGATVGQLDEEELFYLASRGLYPEIARNLLTYGFAEEVIEKIKVDSLKAELDSAVLNRLHAQLEA